MQVLNVLPSRLRRHGIDSKVTSAALYGVRLEHGGVSRREYGIRFSLEDGRTGRYDLLGRQLHMDPIDEDPFDPNNPNTGRQECRQ